MGKIAIRAQNLGKQYHIGKIRGQYETMGEWISDAFTAPFRRAVKLLQGKATGASELDETFWALKDVSFKINHGEIVGIIGENGAGKSTLLKILSRITEPTCGFAKIHGRMGSLLEVGTGFHPQLTGRENIYLNGSILSMKRVEIDGKFDQIVDFAGVEKFIDTPVKHYSSGMHVRLAFAVAAHLEPDILVIDEVLAVGDLAFQKKCLGKMDSVAKEGRTVLFVSHNMAAVQNLCPRSILLKNGLMVTDGATDSVIAQYIKSFNATGGIWEMTHESTSRSGNGMARIQQVEILSRNDETVSSIPMGEGIRVRLKIVSNAVIKSAVIVLGITDPQGRRCCRINSLVTRNWTVDLHPGQSATVECHIPQMNLSPGEHRLWFKIKASEPPITLDYIDNAITLEVVPADVFKTGRLLFRQEQDVIFLDANWELVSTKSYDHEVLQGHQRHRMLSNPNRLTPGQSSVMGQ